MSQAGIATSSSGPLPPEVPLQFTTEINGPAIPAANNLNVFGSTFEDNYQNGIVTSGSTDTLIIGLTNRIVGTVTTTGAVTSPIITYNTYVGGPGTYAIECRIAAFNTTSTLGAGYSLFGTVRYDGVNANLVGTPDKIINEEGAMVSANVTMTVSGANTLINGLGYVGQTINWSAVALYTYVGA